MQSPDIRARLEHCQHLLGTIAVPPELDELASDLIAHLIQLHDANRLTPAFLLLAMKAFEEVQALAPVLAPLTEIASAQAQAEGYREPRDYSGRPWVVSRYDPLQA
ncbi:MAG: hypothetical protein QM777_20585 [Pseudorhodoferax sp.]